VKARCGRMCAAFENVLVKHLDADWAPNPPLIEIAQ
jgi:hypothetical protein